MHLSEARRDRDGAADHRDEATEENRHIAVAREPLLRLVDVGLVDEMAQHRQLLDPANEATQALLADVIADRVERQRADHRAERGGDHHADEGELALTDRESGERQDEFGGDGRDQVLDSDEQKVGEPTLKAFEKS